MRQRIPQIELLRVLAMAGVFFFHLWSVLPEVGERNPLGPLFGAILAQGLFGVVVFNAITGFVLTLPLAVGGDAGQLPFGTFFRRRFWRICPQYYLALALWGAVALFTTPSPGASFGRCFVEHVLFVHTLDPDCFYGIVPAMWWMGLLAQFYLCFPLVLRLFTRLGPGRAFLVVSAACYGLWGLLEYLAALGRPWTLPAYMVYFNLPARLPEFAAGMFLAFRWTRWQETPAGAVQGRNLDRSGLPLPAVLALACAGGVGVALAVAFENSLAKPAVHFLMAFSYLALCGALCTTPLAARIGGNRIVVRLAGASYSIYLLHQPLLGMAARITAGRMPPLAAFFLSTIVVGVLAFVGALFLDLAAATLFFRTGRERKPLHEASPRA